MATPFIALVTNTETFDPSAHSRRDIEPFRMSIKQKEFELAYLQLEVLNPIASLGYISNQRILVSDRGRLLFDGVVQPSPRGLIGSVITVEAIAKPPSNSTFDEWMAELAESLKQESYDPLLVPAGSEDKLEEILAFRTQVIGHSRIQGRPQLCDALGGTNALVIRPLKDSVEYEQENKVAKAYRLNLEAKWKQIGRQSFTVDGINNTKTLTPGEFLENWPKLGNQIGDGFSVDFSTGERKKRRLDKDKVEEPGKRHARIQEKTSSLDPVWAAAGKLRVESPEEAELNLALSLQYNFEVRRIETAALEISTNIQSAAANEEVEEESITLRDLTEESDGKPWQPDFEYAVDDLITDGGNIYRCRTAHTSRLRRESTYWILVGETNYLASRRTTSFFKSDRGNKALNVGLQYLIARASIASRCVTVRFEAAMPKPWEITHDIMGSINHDKLPGGSALGRLVEYEMIWDGGRRTYTGTLACVPGGGVNFYPYPILADVAGRVPSAFGRVDHELTNALEDQLKAFNDGANIPITQLTIKTTPVPSADFEQEVEPQITGILQLSDQVRLQ